MTEQTHRTVGLAHQDIGRCKAEVLDTMIMQLVRDLHQVADGALYKVLAGHDGRAVIEQLLKLEVPRIVYVSCNPATQARDLTLLDPKYRVAAVQPVDMFPHTQHVENVVLLQLKF